MEVEKNKPLFDTSISYDSSHLPKFLQEEIEELENLSKIGDDFQYDLKFDVFEMDAKSCILSRQITEQDFNILMRKYGWYCD